MSTYAYTAYDSKGKVFTGDIEERTWTQALRRVRQMGLFPACVKERDQRPLREKFKVVLPLSRARASADSAIAPAAAVSPARLAEFTRQLATLLDAGIPLLRGLRSIQEQEEDRKLKGLVGALMRSVEGGSTFSEALALHPKIFTRLYVSMVVAGETAGMLEATLARLADFMERSMRTRARIKAALFYPAAVTFVAVSIMSVLMLWVIPRFKEVFTELTGGAGLPPFTEFVLNSSHFFKDHALLLLAMVVGAAISCKLVRSTPPGRAAIDALKLKLPVVGRIIRKAAVSRFARTLGSMLQNGVPVLEALTLTRETTANTVFARALQLAHDRVKGGEDLTRPLQTSGVFPSTVISMIDVGEQTGALPNMLLRVADDYDEAVDRSIGAALSLLEPALIIFLAVIVGSIVIALFLPITGMITIGVDGGAPAGGGGE